MIVLENSGLVLPGFALKEISLTVREKDFFALIGPTGSGKSLLLEGIMGLMPFNCGKLTFNGRNLDTVPVEKRNLAIVYQDFALFPHLDVTQNILYGTRYQKIDSNALKQRLDSLVETLGLDRILQRRPHNLSGGEKQRVALARSLILNPRVLLLDEPLSALDPVFHNGAKNLLKKIHKELDMTIIMVSHNFQDVVYLANRGAIIHKGRILQQGDTLTLFERPNARFTAEFVGMKNIIPIRVVQGKIKLQGNGPDIHPAHCPDETHTHMGIRPEDIVYDSNGSGTWANRFKGTIEQIDSHGVFLDIRLQTGSMAFEAIWPRSHMRDYGFVPGQAVDFAFHSESVHTF